jgi:ferredoxin
MGDIFFTEEFSASPEVIEKFCKTCTEILKIPAVAKIPLQVAFPLLSAQACERGGVSGLMFANSSLRPGLSIDIETGEVGLPGFPCFQGVWGPWVALLICGNIANFRIHGLKLDISGCGGIFEPEDVIRFIMAGANTVQIARTVMIEGWGIATEFLEFIQKWMGKKGYKNFDEIRGIAAKKVVTDWTKFDDKLEIPQIMGGPPPKLRIVVNKKKCISCGWCESGCMHLAIEINGKHPEVDRKLCEVCGMCEALCPVRAISIMEA